MVNNDRILQLIPKAKLISFKSWESVYSPEVVNIFLSASAEARYINDGELTAIATIYPQLAEATAQSRILKDRAATIVQRAREQLLSQYPGITSPGGDLYPEERSNACWRDFWHYLRCISYAVAGQQKLYICPEGLENLRLLYLELNVPFKAMIAGLENLRVSALQEFPEKERDDLAAYFEELIVAMKTFLS